MCKYADYSLDDLIKECSKCRVLCKHCHKIHTNKQAKEGLFKSRNGSRHINKDSQESLDDESDDSGDDRNISSLIQQLNIS